MIKYLQSVTSIHPETVIKNVCNWQKVIFCSSMLFIRVGYLRLFLYMKILFPSKLNIIFWHLCSMCIVYLHIKHIFPKSSRNRFRKTFLSISVSSFIILLINLFYGWFWRIENMKSCAIMTNKKFGHQTWLKYVKGSNYLSLLIILVTREYP